MNSFHLDIITPTSIKTFEDVSYIRAPGLDGLFGIQANHANAIIALGIGELKIDIQGNILYFSTAGGYTDIQSRGVQLLLESFESSKSIDLDRAKKSLNKAQKRIQDKTQDIVRAKQSLLRAKNRLSIISKK